LYKEKNEPIPDEVLLKVSNNNNYILRQYWSNWDRPSQWKPPMR
jgi:hypothetical protein